VPERDDRAFDVTLLGHAIAADRLAAALAWLPALETLRS
jgi:hypothetical protein